MASLFKRKKRSAEIAIEPENRPEQRLDRLYAEMVPSSARSPELQRLLAPGVADDDDPDAPDDDVEFLSSLVREIERKPLTTSRFQPPPAPPGAEPAPVPTEEQKLNVFRELQGAPIQERRIDSLQIEEARLEDVLEDLLTTAAALRLRKAA